MFGDPFLGQRVEGEEPVKKGVERVEKEAVRRDTFLDGAGATYLQKVWSDEAREAAAAARSRNAGSRADAATRDRGMYAPSVQRHGWTSTNNPDPVHDEGYHFNHPDRPGEDIRLHPEGNWRHTSPGGLDVRGSGKKDLENYLAHLHGTTQADQPRMPSPMHDAASNEPR